MQAILILSWHHIFIMDMLNMDTLHMCIYVYMLSHFSHVWLFVTPWTIIHQAPLSMGILQVRTLEWVAMPSSRGSSQPRDQTCVSYILHWQAGSLSLAPPGKRMAWFSSVQSSHSVMSDSLQPHGLQDTRLPCPSPSLEFTQTHVHWFSDTIQLSHPLLSPSPPTLNLSQIRAFSNESVLHIRWPKYWSFSFSISPSSENSGLISFRIDCLDLFAVQGTLKSLQHHSQKHQFFALSFLYSPTLTFIHNC